MDKETKATEIPGQPIAPDTTVIPAVQTEEDIEAKIAALEAAKAKALEEAANYKIAYLKEKTKAKDFDSDDETEDERIERIVQEKITATKVAQIDLEKEALLAKALKENKELKLAQLNKTTTPPAAVGTHSEGTPVTSTLITPEQMAAFKARGWTDKDIERYKKNLQRYTGR